MGVRVSLAAIGLALLLQPASALAQQQDNGDVGYPSGKQPVRPKEVLRSVLGNLSPRAIGPDWDHPADLMPVMADGFRGYRFNLQTPEQPASWSPAIRLYYAPPGANTIAEFPFKVSMTGISRLDFSCELLSMALVPFPTTPVADRPRPEVLAVTRHSFAMSGPGAGIMRIGFVAAAPTIPDLPRVAICRLEAVGSSGGRRWRTHHNSDLQFANSLPPPLPVLIDETSGTSFGSPTFRIEPVTTAYAFDAALRDNWLWLR